MLPRLAELDCVEDIGVFSFYGIQGGYTKQLIGKGIPGVKPRWMDCFPLRAHLWGADVILDHAKFFNADLIITLVDVWTMEQQFWAGGYRWAPWAPIDCEPIPEPMETRFKLACYPITYAKFARDALLEKGIENTYIPHGVETSTFRPFSARGRRESKKLIGFQPDNYVVGMVAANKGYPPRKAFPWIFEAFAEFVKKHPEARLYMHSLATAEMGGPDLLLMAKSYGISEFVRFSDPYYIWLGNAVFDQKMMNRIYNSFDVMLESTMGEGFGLPIIEAEAAGVPVIVGNNTSMPELIDGGRLGWLVENNTRFWIPHGSWQFIPSVEDIYRCLEESYVADRVELGRQARRFVERDYNWDVLVAEHWKPFLEQVLEEITPRSYLRTA